MIEYAETFMQEATSLDRDIQLMWLLWFLIPFIINSSIFLAKNSRIQFKDYYIKIRLMLHSLRNTYDRSGYELTIYQFLYDI